MADNDFRTTRREPLARNDSDPLAELARLIGQSDPRGGRGRGGGQTAQYFEEPTPTTQLDWAAAEEYVQRSHEADGYASSRPADESFPLPPRDSGSWRYDPDEQESAQQHSTAPGAFDDAHAALARFGGSHGDPASRAPSLAYVSPFGAGDPSDEDGEHGRQASPHSSGDEAEDEYYDDEVRPPRRKAVIIVVALLGVLVVGTAGALGYHAVFGGSLIPSLPPIIKPGNTPVKIVPNKDAGAGAASQQNAGSKAADDRLVPHQEKPVDVQAANPVPRVVTTIPVVTNMPPGVLPADQMPTAPQPAPAPPPPAPPPPAMQAAQPPAAAPPAQPSTAPNQLSGPPSAVSSSGSRPVHTVIIKPGQPPAAAATPPAAGQAAAQHAAKVHQAASRSPQTTSPLASAGPLSIVPSQDNAEALPPPPPPRTRTAMTHPSSGPMSLGSTGSPAEEAPAPRAGGYAVQVSSQRSEAEAQAAFRTLQAKYPNQLGSRHATFRRADLGAKGVYYRALVGPFASAEQAASLCRSLKAAGGSCLIQRN
jgi:SPOR domain